jgi:hypothetical protein
MSHFIALAAVLRTIGALVAVGASLSAIWWVWKNRHGSRPPRTETPQSGRRYAGLGR